MRSAARRRPSLLFGITGTGVLHLPGDIPDIDTRFGMVHDAGVFDYYDRTPPTGELDAYMRASATLRASVLAGGFFYTLGRDEPLLEWHLRIARPAAPWSRTSSS